MTAVLWIILVLNWSVAALKVFLGFATQCMVIVADGAHSFSDGTSNIIGLIGIHWAVQPADREHPYGHQKFETLASTGIGLMLLAVAFGIVQKAAQSFRTPMTPEITSASFGVMLLTLGINLLVVFFERRKAKQLKSELLSSDAWHTMTDVFVTLSVLVALVGIRLHWPMLDAIFSIGIGGVIVWVAVGILKRSSEVLVDHAMLDPAAVERVVRGVEGVLDCHEVRTRGRQEEVYVDMHVLVDPEMSVSDSHHLANRIEARLRQEMPRIHDVVVHIEPVSHEHGELE